MKMFLVSKNYIKCTQTTANFTSANKSNNEKRWESYVQAKIKAQLKKSLPLGVTENQT